MITPPIALLMTTYNRQGKLERALASLEPELDLLDIILVDDGSDLPVDLKGFEHFPIHMIRLEKNQRAMAASNIGLQYIYDADYEFIARLDSDDVVINNRFTKQLAFMQKNTDIGLVGSHYDIVNPEGKLLFHARPPIAHKHIRNGLYLASMLHHPTWMMRTEAAKAAGFYNTNFVAAGDGEFCWRIMDVSQVANIPESLIRYEVGDLSSLSVRWRYRQALNGLRIRLKYFEILNPYCYIGFIASIVCMTNIVSYSLPIKRIGWRILFGKPDHPDHRRPQAYPKIKNGV